MTTDKIETGGPMFPCEGVITRDGILYEGMSLRTYAAIKNALTLSLQRASITTLQGIQILREGMQQEAA